MVGWLSLFGFRCVSLSFSTRQSFETKTDDTGARTLRMYDLALRIDNNDNQMTCRAYSLFGSLIASFAPSLRSGATDATRATSKLYAFQMSCDCTTLFNGKTVGKIHSFWQIVFEVFV